MEPLACVRVLGKSLSQFRHSETVDFQSDSDSKLTLSCVPCNGYAPKKDASPGDCVFESELRRPCPKV
jgi:hypothetical protein